MLNIQHDTNDIKKHWLTHHIEQANTLVKVGEKHFTKLHGIHIGSSGRRARIIFFDGSEDKMLLGCTITKGYSFLKLDAKAYNGLHYIVQCDILGNYTIGYS